MCVIDWKSTCGSPIECTRKRSKDRTTPASIGFTPSCGRDLPRAILPWRWDVSPAAAEHRRDDVHIGPARPVRVAVEAGQGGKVARQELAAAMLGAWESSTV